MWGWVEDILNWFNDIIVAILLLLPESPFSNLTLDNMPNFSKVMGWINYFVPVGGMLTILTLYLSAVFIWYGIRWVLRLAQYID